MFVGRGGRRRGSTANGTNKNKKTLSGHCWLLFVIFGRFFKLFRNKKTKDALTTHIFPDEMLIIVDELCGHEHPEIGQHLGGGEPGERVTVDDEPTVS